MVVVVAAQANLGARSPDGPQRNSISSPVLLGSAGRRRMVSNIRSRCRLPGCDGKMPRLAQVAQTAALGFPQVAGVAGDVAGCLSLRTHAYVYRNEPGQDSHVGRGKKPGHPGYCSNSGGEIHSFAR